MIEIPSQSSLARPREWITAHTAELICSVVLVVMALNYFAVISRKTLTNDENYHVPAGYYHLVFGNFQVNPEHPPLVKMISALPLVLLRPIAPTPTINPAENPIVQGHGAFLAFWQANPQRLEAIAFWARVPMIALSLLFGFFLFTYARYLGGPIAAICSVVMFSLEPTVLAHGRVVQTDMPAAFAYLLFFFALQLFFRDPSLRRSILLGITAGLALVTKFSLLIVLPVFVGALCVMAWRSLKNDTRRACVKLGSAILSLLIVVNLAYYFERSPLLPANREEVITAWPAHTTAVARGFDAVSTIVPPAYLFGAFVVNLHNDLGHYASIIGKYSRTGWWYYFPLAFALKTSIPFLLISTVSFVWAVWSVIRDRQRQLAIPILAAVLYTTSSMASNINIGVRHFLPVMGILFLLGGVFLAQLYDRYRRFALIIILVSFSWMAFEALRAFPNYIPYTNQFARSHPQWYYLSDSNVEWGDDTNQLAEYLRDRGETKVRAALLGGWLSKIEYGIDYINPFVIDEPVEHTRYIAIGASYLNGSTVPLIHDRAGRTITDERRRNFFAAYRDRKPEAVFGNSIYLFRED